MDEVERAERLLGGIDGDVFTRLDAWANELGAHKTVAEANGDAAAALIWGDAFEGVLAALDFLAERARAGALQR